MRNESSSQAAPLATIPVEDFFTADLRVGTVIAAEVFPQARKPAYKLRIDFGPTVGTKNSSAQITVNYIAEELVGMRVVAVINFPPRQIANFVSEVLLLGVADRSGGIRLLTIDNRAISSPVADGARVT